MHFARAGRIVGRALGMRQHFGGFSAGRLVAGVVSGGGSGQRCGHFQRRFVRGWKAPA